MTVPGISLFGVFLIRVGCLLVLARLRDLMAVLGALLTVDVTYGLNVSAVLQPYCCSMTEL